MTLSIHPLCNHKQKTNFLFILTVLMIYPLPEIAIDLYLPSWPAMVKALHANHRLLQLSLTAYVFSMGIAQLIYGSLSDKYGRKPVLLFGVLLFFLGSIVAARVTSAYELILCRFIQGLGLGCGFTIASAILADCFESKRLAQLTSYSAMVYSLALILAPVTGGYLQHYFNWQANFLAMAIYAFFLLASIHFFIFETKKEKCKKPFSFYTLIKNYLFFFKQAYFMGNVICLVFAYGVIIAFNLVSPFLFLDIFHVSAVEYGKLLLLLGFSYFFGASINSQALKSPYLTTHKMIIMGLICLVIASIGLEILNFIGLMNVKIIMGSFSLGLIGVGFIYPNCFANALEVFPNNSYSCAFIGSAILVGISVIGMFITHLNHRNCISYVFLILTALSIITYLFTVLIKERSNLT